MRENLKQGGIFILHVILTALASAAIAILQSYIQAHGIDAGPIMTPENNALIGTGIGAFTKAIKIV